MQYLLSAACRSTLKRLAEERTLYGFDFDGTLSPIVDFPERANISRRTRTLLNRLAAIRPCVIVSGRARPDLLGKLDGIKVARVIGNHGAETGTFKPAPLSLVERWKKQLELELNSLSGVWVEDKALSLAVHYRQAKHHGEAHRKIVAACGKLEYARVFGGKEVVNLAPDGSPHKGIALAAERDRLGCDWIFYVGDDENDEDAFALDGNVIPVRVGRKKTSHARYFLRSQPEIDTLLEVLLLEAAKNPQETSAWATREAS